MKPIYVSDNCHAAFQLNWSVALFGKVMLPFLQACLSELKTETDGDGVSIMETRVLSPNVAQFFVSTRPNLAPAGIVRSLKGRWQYLIRHQNPAAFRRNYFITGVGDANSETMENYVARQVHRHPMADDRVTAMLESLQFHDPDVLVDEEIIGSHGKYSYGLQIVIENSSGWNEIRGDVLNNSREMIIRVAAAKGWRLGRIGILSNHIHIMIGCGVNHKPEEVALSLLNNLAYAQGMRPAYRFSYYVGTFGKYDRNAIRQWV